MLRKAWIPALIVALLSLALLAAACGSDDDDDNGGQPTASPPAATVPQDGETPAATEPQDGGPTEPADDGPAETISEVSLTEFAVNVATDTVPAGSVTFAVRNDGTIIHDFAVIRSDLAPDALPQDEAAFVVDEDQVEVVGSTEQLDVGQSEDLALDLESGSYILICNVATHYDAGMFLGFTVE